MSMLVEYLKHKKKIQTHAQHKHDKALRQYQEKLGDYGYDNFINPITNKFFKRVFLLADFEKIDRELVPILYDNRK